MDSRFSCSICDSFASLNYSAVVRHIGSVHAWEPRFKITCGIEGCIRTYTSYRRYREHITNKHGDLLIDDAMDTGEVQEDYQHVHGSDEEMMVNPFDDSTVYNDVQTDCGRHKLYNKALFLLKLSAERLSQVAINSLIGDVSTLLEEETLSLKKDVVQCMQEGHASNELISRVNEQFSKKIAATPFEGLHTSYLQKKYYNDHFYLVVCIYK